MKDHPILFIPGPTEVDAELRELMSMPLVGHRSQGFVDTAQEICTRLKKLFMTEQNVAFENCPATALMEASIRNLIKPGGRTLHLTNGAFSERWAKISSACGRKPESIQVPWGRAHNPWDLESYLTKNSPFEAVMITHNETSTGVLQPLKELSKIIRKLFPNTLILVDVVTSLAGSELFFDEWEIDIAFAGTQKCLALPPGLCVYALSDRALQVAGKIPDRGFLLDFTKAIPETNAGKTIATPCVPLVYALRRQLERIETETLKARWSRHKSMREMVFQWAEKKNIQPFVDPKEACSYTVSCFQASGFDVKKMAESASQKGFKIDQGYGDLKGKTFRIGHMGDHSLETLKDCLKALL
jgi:aspartate aminotransferase-like enzyme